MSLTTSISDLKKIKKAVDNMNLDNLKNIYNIITRNNQPITRKSDCFLINLGNLNVDTINEIIQFIDFIESNSKLLEEDEKVKNEYAEEFKQLQESI
jgi:nicotinate-nucleotide pyrophosphorylase